MILGRSKDGVNVVEWRRLTTEVGAAVRRLAAEVGAAVLVVMLLLFGGRCRLLGLVVVFRGLSGLVGVFVIVVMVDRRVGC